ncbi:MAG: SufS family cysteine desulfurase [Simkaniaceae bacterium]|nr:SufS family cysteine desulfurase [Simkaniaceae bacterium]
MKTSCELDLRSDFPHLVNKPDWIYLDSAATTQKPQCVIDAISNFYSHDYATVHRTIYEAGMAATDAYNAVRAKVAQFIGASEEEIVFTSGTTESINLVANSIEPDDEVIISEMEHHSNIVPWQKANLKVIPIRDGVLDLEAFEKLLSPKTKIVSIGHISNATGVIHPVKKIIEMAHSVGALVMIDGAQAPSHLALNMRELDVDFYAFSGHKLYGPTGIGVLYGKSHLLESMSPFMKGGDMIETVTLEKTTYAKAPLKFEAGTPKIAEVIGLGAAIDYVESIGLETIAAHENALVDRAMEIDLPILSKNAPRGPILTFSIEDVHSLDLATLLDLRGIAVRSGHLCAQPALAHFGISSALRASFGIYNTIAEVDAFTQAVQEIIEQLR